MKTVALIAIHGMGTPLPKYSEPLQARLRSRLGQQFDKVEIQEVYYQKLLQDNERMIWERVDRGSKVHYDELRKFFLFGFGDAAGLEVKKDEDGSMYEMAQLDIAKKLWAASQQTGPGAPVVFITQSLGCQVLSNYIYDAQKAEAHLRNPGLPAVGAGIWKNIHAHASAISGAPLSDEEVAFLACRTCMAWVSTGCNIPIFVAAHMENQIVPIDPPTHGFKWLNLYDPDDVLGWPLQPLSSRYAELVEDRQVNAGQGAAAWILKSWNPMAHTAYWTDDDVVKPLASFLQQLSN